MKFIKLLKIIFVFVMCSAVLFASQWYPAKVEQCRAWYDDQIYLTTAKYEYRYVLGSDSYRCCKFESHENNIVKVCDWHG